MTTETVSTSSGSIHAQPDGSAVKIRIRIDLERSTDTSEETWVAHCLELDALAQGASPIKALEAIAQAIDIMVNDEIAALESSGQIYNPAWVRAFTNIAEDVASWEAPSILATVPELTAGTVTQLAAGIVEAGGTLPYPGQIACASAHPAERLQRRMAKVLWREATKASNPWFHAAAAGHADCCTLWEEWNRKQLELTRSLYAVVFRGAEPTEALLAAALDFMGG